MYNFPGTPQLISIPGPIGIPPSYESSLHDQVEKMERNLQDELRSPLRTKTVKKARKMLDGLVLDLKLVHAKRWKSRISSDLKDAEVGYLSLTEVERVIELKAATGELPEDEDEET